MCCNVFTVWPMATLLPVWPRDAKRLDIPATIPQAKNTVKTWKTSQELFQRKLYRVKCQPPSPKLSKSRVIL